MGRWIGREVDISLARTFAFTRYCHHQYHMAYIAIKGGQGDIIYCAIVWAMRGGEGGTQTKELFANHSVDSCTKASK